jgi:hypothetical protein
MHHSEDPERKSVAVTCYCDDSDSDALAFIGGPVFNRSSFIKFNQEWARMLHLYRIDAVHMTDFVRPHGIHVGMHYEMKLALFTALTKAIRRNRLYSISLAIPKVDFKQLVAPDISKELMQPYTMAFFMAVMTNNAVATVHGFDDRIAYLVDHGSFDDQLNEAHKLVLEWEMVTKLSSHTGPMTFDNDDNNNALQAADVIAWVARRRRDAALTLGGEFTPLQKLFDHQIDINKIRVRPHIEIIMPREGIEKFAKGMTAWIVKYGRMPVNLVESFGPPKR